MELRDRDGDLFTNIEKVNNVYPVRLTAIPPRAGLAAWTTEGELEPTHEELVGHLESVAMVATAKGADGTKATLMTCHRWLGHPSFKPVVPLFNTGISLMLLQ